VSDVSAALLTIGEPAAERAMASIEAQSLAAREIVTVENVSPFYRALNEAARRVSTPYFVQVDADMILDPGCFDELRAAVGPDTGIVVGELRDPMMGQIVGVKLFRTACFEASKFKDSISMDTDFVASIRRHGWRTEYVWRAPGASDASRTLGEHRPDYTPAYTYRKYILEGGRLRYRGAQAGLRWRIGRLESSDHEFARLGLIALAHGFFRTGDRDGLVPMDDGVNARPVTELLESSVHCEESVSGLIASVSGPRLRDVFWRFLAAGHDAASAKAGATVHETLNALSAAGDNWRCTAAKLAFAHGVLSAGDTKANLAADEKTLQRFLTVGAHQHATAWGRALGGARYRFAGLTGRREWQW
jgi:hypothetical protein